jgi:uncharacterized protein (TIGR02246 family)
MDSERIEACYRELLSAWNRRDASAFAGLFTEDGYFIAFDGSEMHGRAKIASTLAAVYQNERTATYIAAIREVKELVPGVVLLRAVVGMVPPDSLDLHLTVTATQSVVLVERDLHVAVALLQSTPTVFHGRSEVAEALTLELEMILRSQNVKH